MKKGGDGEREREDLKPRLCHWGDGKREREELRPRLCHCPDLENQA